MDIFHFLALIKVTNTFVLPSWPGTLLSGCACESVGVAQEARDHSFVFEVL